MRETGTHIIVLNGIEKGADPMTEEEDMTMTTTQGMIGMTDIGGEIDLHRETPTIEIYGTDVLANRL